MVENDRIFKFLVGLNIEFDEVKGRIIGRSPLPSLEEVFAEVWREESHCDVMLGKKVTTIPFEHSALIAADANRSRSICNQRPGNDKPCVWCNFCNKPRYTCETCRKIHGKPENWKSSRPSERFSQTTPVHEPKTIPSPFNKEQTNLLLRMLNSNPQPGIPSGSLAQNSRIFCTFSCHSNYLPDLACNLISIGQLSKNSNCRVLFLTPIVNFRTRERGWWLVVLKWWMDSFDDNPLSNKHAQGFRPSISSLPACERIML